MDPREAFIQDFRQFAHKHNTGAMIVLLDGNEDLRGDSTYTKLWAELDFHSVIDRMHGVNPYGTTDQATNNIDSALR